MFLCQNNYCITLYMILPTNSYNMMYNNKGLRITNMLLSYTSLIFVKKYINYLISNKLNTFFLNYTISFFCIYKQIWHTGDNKWDLSCSSAWLFTFVFVNITQEENLVIPKQQRNKHLNDLISSIHYCGVGTTAFIIQSWQQIFKSNEAHKSNFLFRSNIDVCNSQINHRLEECLKIAFKHEIKKTKTKTGAQLLTKQRHFETWKE
jgi:hypothetical protein